MLDELKLGCRRLAGYGTGLRKGRRRGDLLNARMTLVTQVRGGEGSCVDVS